MNAIFTSVNGLVNNEFVTRIITESYLQESSFNPAWYPQGIQSSFKTAMKAGLLQLERRGQALFVSVDEAKLASLMGCSTFSLREIRRQILVAKYSLATEPSETSPVMVKSNHALMESGIYRAGFARVSHMGYRYDRAMLALHRNAIEDSIIADIDVPDGHKTLDYQEIIHEVVDNMLDFTGEYFSSDGYADQRGRFYFTKGAFTPQNNKLARSLMQLPQPVALTANGRDAVAMFISELAGVKASSAQDRLVLGYDLLDSKAIPDGLHLWEQIWLQRIYENWSDQSNWLVPIELDATASAVQFLSVLLNDHALMEQVNLIYDGILHDFWASTDLPREHMKRYLTPHIYGSQASARDLWMKNHLQVTPELLAIAKRVENLPHVRGIFLLKNHILENMAMPQPEMNVNIGTESFTVHCTRFVPSRRVEFVRVYKPINDKIGVDIPIRVPNLKEPDLESFKRFFPSCLIHNLDSQVANQICRRLDWVIPNHDAWIISPNDGLKLRLWYVSLLHRKVYAQRHSILARYLASIGCKGKINDVSRGEVQRFSVACLK